MKITASLSSRVQNASKTNESREKRGETFLFRSLFYNAYTARDAYGIFSRSFEVENKGLEGRGIFLFLFKLEKAFFKGIN